MKFFFCQFTNRISQVLYCCFTIVLCFVGTVFPQADYPESVMVNSTTDGHQDSPVLAANGAGTVVIVFESETPTGDESVFAISYDRQNFREFFRTGPTTDTAGLEALPDDEHFIIAWEQNNKLQFTIVSCKNGEETFVREPGPIKSGIYAFGQRPDVAISKDGNIFAIGWHIDDVFMHFYNVNGDEIGDIISVADNLAYKQRQLSIKFATDSTLVAVWHSETSGSFEGQNRDEDIWFQRFDCKPVWEGGAPVKIFTEQKRANGDLTTDGPVWFNQEYPEVDTFDDCHFAVSWQDFPYNDAGAGSDGSGKGAYFRIFNSDGTPQTDDIQISEYTNSFQKDADFRIRQSDKTIHFI